MVSVFLNTIGGSIYMNDISAYKKGLRDGIPIALGYFAVAFSLGFMAKKCSISPLQGFICSFFTRASAGEYGGYTIIMQDAGILGMIAMSIVTNLRYLLMSTALSQKFSPDTPFFKRILTGFCVTDEIFGISIAYNGYLNPYYTFGAFSVSTPLWALGTMLGIIAGNILPARAVSALSVALYGMFIAIIIPPCKKDRAVLLSVTAGFILSFFADLSGIAGKLGLNSGITIIVLTILISAVTAYIKPHPQDTAFDSENNG